MIDSNVLKGWGLVMGIPALFSLAYILGMHPAWLGLPACGVRLFLDIPCPGCGLTHAFAALAHGDLRDSIRYHPLGVVIAAWLVYQFGRAVYTMGFKRQPRHLLSDETRYLVLNLFIAALMLQWLLGFIVDRFAS